MSDFKIRIADGGNDALAVVDYGDVRKAFDEQLWETMTRIRSGETHLDNLAEGFAEADRVLRKMCNVICCEDCYRATPIPPTHMTGWVDCGEWLDCMPRTGFCYMWKRRTNDG